MRPDCYKSDCGGLGNFLKCHVLVVKMLDAAQELGILRKVKDEGGFWEGRDVQALARENGEWNAATAAVVGKFKDMDCSALVAPILRFPDFEHLEAKGHYAQGYGHQDRDRAVVWVREEEMNRSEDFWTQHPYAKAIEIVKTGFGDHYVLETPDVYQKRPIRRVFVYPCEAPPIEQAVKAELDKIGWQMIIISLLDKSRFKSMRERPTQDQPFKPGCNFYGIAPIELLFPRPTRAFHATELLRAERIRKEGLRPNFDEGDYPDTEGKVHVCTSRVGETKSSAYWAKRLSERKGLSLADYMILEVNLSAVPHARIYDDLHSVPGDGIIVDKIDSIPIVSSFVYSKGKWEQEVG